MYIDKDGNKWHDDANGEPLLDENGDMIPANICYCAAWCSCECACGAWDYNDDDELQCDCHD